MIVKLKKIIMFAVEKNHEKIISPLMFIYLKNHLMS